MAPLIRRLEETGWAEVIVANTAQHRELSDDPLALFGITPQIDLDLMRPDQDLARLTARLIEGIDNILAETEPDVVLAQGDTTTVLAAALVAFYRRVPFGHVEAGLRTGDLSNPFPEEANRTLAARLTRLHFAPTERASENLVAEGVSPDWVHVTGNTVIDALLWVAARVEPRPDGDRRLILVTAHRRESFGPPLMEICQALMELAGRFPDVEFLYPVHPNPNVAGPVREMLAGREGIILSDPLDYQSLVAAMKRSHLILTDSGGIQEEAPALGVPVLVLRRETERPEALAAGVARLVGPDKEAVVAEASRLLSDPAAHQAMVKGVSPFGDGRAAERIELILARFLGVTV